MRDRLCLEKRSPGKRFKSGRQACGNCCLSRRMTLDTVCLVGLWLSEASAAYWGSWWCGRGRIPMAKELCVEQDHRQQGCFGEGRKAPGGEGDRYTQAACEGNTAALCRAWPDMPFVLLWRTWLYSGLYVLVLWPAMACPIGETACSTGDGRGDTNRLPACLASFAGGETFLGFFPLSLFSLLLFEPSFRRAGCSRLLVVQASRAARLAAGQGAW